MQQAVPVNARMQFQWRISVEGPTGALDEFKAQSVKVPASEIANAEIAHGGQVGTTEIGAGIARYEKMVIKELMVADTTNREAMNWFRTVVNDQLNRVGVPVEYMRTITVELLDNNMEAVEFHTFENCYVSKVDMDEMVAKNKEPAMKTIEITVGRKVSLD